MASIVMAMRAAGEGEADIAEAIEVREAARAAYESAGG